MKRSERLAQIDELRSSRNALVDEIGEILDRALAERRPLTAEERESVDAKEAAAKELRESLGVAERHLRLEDERAGETPRTPRPELEDPAGSARTLGLSQKELRGYSLLRAFRSMVERGSRVPHADDCGFELELSRELQERSGLQARGLMVPYDVLGFRNLRPLGGVERRDISVTTTGTEAAALVATDLLVGSFIELLRNAAMVVRAGARVLPGLVGDVDIPRQSAGGTAGWVLEAGNVALSELATNVVALTPKTVGLRQIITRRALKQTTPAIEDLVRDDITAAIGLAIDLGAIAGLGAGDPQGILNTAGVGAVVTGGGLTWPEVLEFETDLAAANALMGSVAWMMSPGVRAVAKQTEKAATTAQFLMAEDGMMNGYPSFVTNQVPGTVGVSGTAILGNWLELLIGLWGGVDLFGDPYTAGDSGALTVRGFQDADVALRHPASFTAAEDI